jgi:CRISPR/Cas system-associated endoribonuclease Cas2
LSRLAKRPSWTKKYRTKRSNGINLIVFDIPEKKRIARDWLRVKLKEFGYKPIQQSVWLGKNGVSFEFISDLRNYEILDCIHILKICNKGSIGALLP